MNDVVNAISDCSIYLYADDIVIFKSSSDIDSLTNSLQLDLDNFFEWTEFSEFDINMTKTRKMIFSRKKIENIYLHINGTVIETVENYTYFGLTIYR